jgi:hypothetical protein
LAASAQQTGLGIKGGAVAATTRSEVLSTTFIPGAVLGIYFPWGFAPKMELQPEMLVGTNGARYIEPDGDRYSIRTTYLHVPLTLKIYVTNSFNIHAGAQGSRLIGAERISSDEDNVDASDRINPIDFGLVGGFGLDMRSGLDLTFRYLYGTRPVFSNDFVLYPRNRSITLTAGYRIIQLRVRPTARKRH